MSGVVMLSERQKMKRTQELEANRIKLKSRAHEISLICGDDWDSYPLQLHFVAELINKDPRFAEAFETIQEARHKARDESFHMELFLNETPIDDMGKA